MSLFFFTVFLVYGGMHLYAFLRARIALGFGAVPSFALTGFMVLMTLAPFLIRLFEQHEFQLAARVLSYIAYIWMAVLFLFFCGSLALDVLSLVIRFAGWVGGKSASPYLLSVRLAFFIPAGLALVICVYGYFDALNIRTERLRIETTKLPPTINRLTIVQISDVHLGLIVRNSRLKTVMDIVKAEKPDIFLSTGDLVDAQINDLRGMAELLREVKAPYGNYAITGNHEYYAGIEDALAFTRQAGFTILRGQAITAGPINIAGVDDPTGLQLKVDRPEPITTLLAKLPRDRFTLFLRHRPDVDHTAGLFDLQLSGHTHKGQIYPFTYVSKIAYPLNAGRFDLPGGSILYVSRGTGTWGPPIRFLSPPQVTVIELIRKGA